MRQHRDLWLFTHSLDTSARTTWLRDAHNTTESHYKIRETIHFKTKHIFSPVTMIFFYKKNMTSIRQPKFYYMYIKGMFT